MRARRARGEEACGVCVDGYERWRVACVGTEISVRVACVTMLTSASISERRTLMGTPAEAPASPVGASSFPPPIVSRSNDEREARDGLHQ